MKAFDQLANETSCLPKVAFKSLLMMIKNDNDDNPQDVNQVLVNLVKSLLTNIQNTLTASLMIHSNDIKNKQQGVTTNKFESKSTCQRSYDSDLLHYSFEILFNIACANDDAHLEIFALIVDFGGILIHTYIHT